MMPLEINGISVDSCKSAMLLHYLAGAALKEKKRELRGEELEEGLKHLKRLRTGEIKKKLEGLEGHVEKTLEKARLIEKRQAEEESTHEEFDERLKRVHEKVCGLIHKQEGVRQHIDSLKGRKEDIGRKKRSVSGIEQDLKRLVALYDKVKSSKKYSKEDLESFAQRIERVKNVLRG